MNTSTELISIFVTDTETNGLKNHQHNAISMAVVLGKKEVQINEGKIVGYNPEILDLTHHYGLIGWDKIKPFEIDEETTGVHGLVLEDLKDAPDPFEAYSQFYRFIQDFLDEGKLDVLNGFNVTFDLGMIVTDLMELIKYSEDLSSGKKEQYKDFELNYGHVRDVRKLLDIFYNQDSGEEGAQISSYSRDGIGSVIDPGKELGIKVIDSIIIDRIFHHVDEHGLVIRHNLGSCSSRYGIPEDDDAHNALADTIQTLKVFNLQANEMMDKNIEFWSKEFENRLMNKYMLVESVFNKNPKNIKPYNGRFN